MTVANKIKEFAAVFFFVKGIGYMDKIQGYIDHFIYKNETNGYGVIELHMEDDDIICTGFFSGVEQGENVEIEGEYTDNPTYGLQFKAHKIQILTPQSEYEIEKYLSSGAIKGVGPSLARRIIKRFGSDTFRIMEEEPERLAEVKGISERIAVDIATQMENRKELREAMIFLQRYGISNTLALKIYDTYGVRLYHILKDNPYQMAEELDGIGFKKADEIARKSGISTDSEFRMKSGVCYSLMQAAVNGHTFLPENELIMESAALLELDEEQIRTVLPNLAMEKKIIIKREKDMVSCYIARMYYEELTCAKLLSDLNCIIDHKDEHSIRSRIAEIEKKQQIELDELQKSAVTEAVHNGILILTGGPGTGKTTTINTIIRFFEMEGCDIMLAAPTGRAAKRMTEATGFEAKTIHRLLEINGSFTDDGKKARFEKNEDNPLETDVIIIDEMSMVDIHLFCALLKAVAVGTRLILVGDMNQLPSVGPGQVLRDLIESNAYPVIALKKIFRQAGESDIVVNAHKINRGEEILLNNKSKDFFFLERTNADVIYKHLILLITEKLPKYVDAVPIQIQVLTPMKKGSLGVETLNRILQKYLNPPSGEKKEHYYGEMLFREGDKVMQIKNNYQLEWEIVSSYNIVIDKGLGIFNGDMGIVIEINDYSQTIRVEFDEKRRVTYHFSQLDELELAYAITIHKSQGSEYPAVIIPLLGGPRQLMSRNLLYTGVTRARRCVTILGSRQTVREMIENENEKRRYTGLQTRIHEIERKED